MNTTFYFNRYFEPVIALIVIDAKEALASFNYKPRISVKYK